MTDTTNILKTPQAINNVSIRIWYPWSPIDIEMETSAIERLRVLIEEGSDKAVFCGSMSNGQQIMLTKLHEVFGYSIMHPKDPGVTAPSALAGLDLFVPRF